MTFLKASFILIGIMTLLFILSSFIATLFLVWFNSDFIVEYGKLFGLRKLLRLREYKEKQRETPVPLAYPLFLKMTYDNFFIKLISCPVCLSVWLSIVFGLIFHIWTFIPVICVMSLTLYGIIRKLLT